MPQSQVDICNAALVKIGQDIPISAITEQTKAARVFNRVWTRCLEMVLSERTWPFAVKAVALALVDEAPPPGWSLRYARPADCISAKMVCDEGGVRTGITITCTPQSDTGFMAPLVSPVPFDTIYGEQGTSIVTDLDDAYLIYVSRVTDTSRFPPPFVEALTSRLAMEAAPSLAGELGLRLAGSLQQGYEFSLAKAGAHGMNEYRDEDYTTPAVASRGC